MSVRTTSLRLTLAAMVVLCIAATGSAQSKVTLSASSAPGVAQPGVHTVAVTGAGFPAGTIPAANVTVTVQPVSGSGDTATTPALGVQVMPGTTRRVSFVVPPSLTVSAPTPYLVSIAGTTSTGAAFVSANRAALTINPPAAIAGVAPSAALPGATLDVTLTATYTDFVQGATQASFGPGISVNSGSDGGFGTVTVTSKTTATVRITLGSAATPGPRIVTIRTGVQEASQAQAFVVLQSNRPPTANAAGPYSGTAGQPVSFTGTGTDPDSDPLAYTWAFSDGGSATGATVTHTFAAAGTFTATLTVDDGRGGAHSASAAVTVAAANRPPTASAGGPYSGTAGQSISFTGTGTDADSDPLTYTWIFSDGGSATGAAVTHTFAAAGTFTATLTVDDGRGGTHSATAAVTVAAANRPPTANAGGPYSGAAGQSISFTGTGTDPDGDPLTYTWAFSDGGSATGATVTHTFAAAGAFTATLTVEDGRGGTHSAAAAVAVDTPNVAPSVAIPPVSSVTLPATATISATVTDDGKPELTPTLTWSLVTGPAGATAAFVPPSSATTTVTFSAAGTYRIRLTAFDGALSGSAEAEVVVIPHNDPPAVSVAGDGSIVLPAPASLTATVTDDGQRQPLTLAWSRQDGPGTVTFSSLTASATQATCGTPGTYVLRVTAFDGELTASADITVVATAPTSDNQPPLVNAGGDLTITLPDAAALAGSVTDDGKPAGSSVTAAWSKSSGPGAVAFANAAAASTTAQFVVPGTYVLQLTATDGQLSSTDQVVVTVNPAPVTGDRLSPVVGLTLPGSALPGAQLDVVAHAADNDRVALLRIEIDGHAPAEAAGDTLTARLSVPTVSAPGQVIRVVAIARDPAGNEGRAQASLTVTAVPDTAAPEIRLRGPVTAAPGQAIQVVALASDASGIHSVTFQFDGTEITRTADASFEAGFVVPTTAEPGSTMTVVARAQDGAGNIGESAHTFTVVGMTDTTAPTLALQATGDPRPGSTIVLTANAADDGGVATVAFAVNGMPLATVPNAPYEATYTIPVSVTPGTVLQLAAVATDFAGLSATDTRSLTVTAQPPQVEALVLGEAYDDTTGLPLADAVARLSGAASGGALVSTSTDARGRYALQGVAGDGVVQVRKDGWTGIDRVVTLAAGQGIEAFDARLTPLSAPVAVSPVLGGTVGDARARLVLQAGALTEAASLRVTAVGQQGPQGLLPYGWSPAAVVDLYPHAVAFMAPAVVSAANALGVPAGTPLVFARWDEEALAWRKVADTTVPSAGASLEAGVIAGGHYAWLVPDTPPAAPLADGAVVTGVSPAGLPETVTTQITPQPKVAFYKPGIRVDVRGEVTVPGLLPSGVRIWQRLVETYRYYSGAEVHPEPFVQDLVLYRSPTAAGVLAASSVVSPSLTFDPVALERGVIAVELYAPGEAGAASLVGAQGSTVAGAAGAHLVVPPGAVSAPTAMSLAAITAETLGYALPAGITLASGVQVTFGGELSLGAELSVPKPAGAGATDSFLLVRLADVAGRTRLVLVGIGRIEGDRLVSRTTVAGQSVALDGVRLPGRYLFVAPARPVGFAAGVVRSAQGGAPAPFVGALVSTDACPVVSLSGAGGAYVAAAPAGAVVLTALDTVRGDLGSASTFLTAAQLLAVPLLIEPQLPRVVSIVPATGSANVALTDPVVITFSKRIDPASVGGGQADSVQLTDPTGAAVDVVRALSSDGAVLTLRPSAALQANTRYTVTVGTTVQDAAGYNLAAAVTSVFDSLDTLPPAKPEAGKLTASVPGQDGETTITGTQGTVSRTDTVYLVNLTDKTTRLVPQALYEADGSFRFVAPARIADKLRLRIVDAAGNETLVDLPRFQQTNSDGSVSAVVDGSGGDVDGPGGVRADVREGAFPDGTVITIQSVSPADIPIQLSTEDQARFAVEGGIQVDFGGASPTRYVNLSMPAPPEATPSDIWLVGRLVTVDGQPTLSIVDTAKLIAGRITTSSPPFSGVTGAGTYVVLASKGPMGVSHGYVANAQNPVNMRLTLMTMNPSLLALASQMPFIVDKGEGTPAVRGFPMPAGRVTLSENTVRLHLAPEVITPIQREFRVRNKESGQVQRYPLVPIDYRVTIDGAMGDGFEITVDGPLGRRPVTSARILAGEAGKVTVRLNPDKIAVPVTAVIVKNLTTERVDTRAFSLPEVRVGVAGGTADGREVTLVDVDGASWALEKTQYEVAESAYGPGNLVLRLMADALNGRGGFSAVHLLGKKGSDIVVPAVPYLEAFAYAFDGDATDDYILRLDYGSQPSHYFPIPRFQVAVRNAATGEVIRTIAGFVPPPDEPMDLGTITDDFIAPYVVSGPSRTGGFDPSGALSITFSEAMDADSLKQYIVLLDGQKRPVAGTVRVSDGNRVATFVPDAPLRMGETYTLMIQGADPLAPEDVERFVTRSAVRDGAGNPVATVALKVTTFAPRLVGSLGGSSPFKDVAFRRKDIADTLTTTLFVTTGGGDNSLLSIDVTDPAHPQLLKAVSAGTSHQRITLLPEVTFTDRTGARFSGDLAISTQFNVNWSSMVFFDVSSRTDPRVLATKVLTVNPDLMTGPNGGNTMFATGLAKGVAAFARIGDGAVAYAAVERVGVMATDVGQNVPQRSVGERLREPVLAGQFTDLVAHQGHLVAIVAGGGENVQVLDPNLAPVGATGVSYVPRRVRVGSGFQVDANGDGVITSDEVYTLAVVAGDFGISLVDLRNPTAPAEIGRVPIPGVVRDVELDPVMRRLLVAADLTSGGPTIMTVDISRPDRAGAVDADGDGVDDRILWRQSYAAGVNGMRLDSERGLLYVANPSGLDVWAIHDSYGDIGVDMQGRIWPRPIGSAAGLFKRELAILKKGIIAGLDRAVEKCPGFQASAIRMLETGSGACLWSDDPEKTCGSNYLPGASDHAFSVFMPDAWDEARVPNPSRTADPRDQRPSTISLAACAVDSLASRFTDLDGSDRQPRDLDGFRFTDITFQPRHVADFQAARYRLSRPSAGEGDADGDLGLGRQLQLLTDLTEGRGTRLGSGDPGFREGMGYEQIAWSDAEFNAALGRLREATQIGLAEGYEWANLMEFQLVKSQALVRIAGAEAETSAFHDRFNAQIRTAARAGMRTALARLVATPAVRDALILKVKRDVTDPGPGLFVLRGDDADACFVYERTISGGLREPATFARTRACRSLEDLVASMAVRTLTVVDEASRPFTPTEVREIVRFYLVQSDEEQVRDALRADQFINDVYRFIQRTKAATADSWTRYVSGGQPAVPREPNDEAPDPDGADRLARRRANMTLKDERLAQAAATIHAVPHVYNLNYRDAGPVPLTLYVRPPGASASTESCRPDETGQPACTMQVYLEGGSHLYPASLLREDGTYQREAASGHQIPAFQVTVNPAVTPVGEVGVAAFTLDLPNRSVKESDRSNNVGGFFYYLLDTSKPIVVMPQIPDEVPLPTSDLHILLPDPGYEFAPSLAISQSLSVGGAELKSPASLIIGEEATLTLTVRNVSSLPATGVEVCTTLTNKCYPLGRIAAHASASAALPFSSPKPVSVQSLPSVVSNETGIKKGSPFLITVSWSGFQLVDLDPNPNPAQAEVMVGGTSYRHFGVISTLQGAPVRGARVTVNVSGALTATKAFTTDYRGVVGTFDRNTGKFDPGIAIPFSPDTLLVHDATVTLADVNGLAFDPATAPKYTIKLKPFEFQEQLQTGLAANLSGSLAFATVGIGSGVSFSATFEQQTTTPKPLGEILTKAFTVGRRTSLVGSFSFNPALEASAEIPLVGVISAKGPEAGVTATRTFDYADNHRFAYPITAEDQPRLAALAFNTTIGALPEGRLLENGIWLARQMPVPQVRRFFDQPMVKSVLGQMGLDERFYEANRVSRGFATALKMDGTLSLFNLGFGDIRGMWGENQRVVNPETTFRFAGVTAGASLSGTLGFSAEDRTRDEQVALGVQLAFSAQATAGLKFEILDSLFQTPFSRVQKRIEASSDSDIKKTIKTQALELTKAKVFEVFKLDEKSAPEKLQLKGSLAGEYELGIVLDKKRGLRPAELSLTLKDSRPFGPGEPATEGARYALTYTVKSEASIKNALENLATMANLMGPDARASVTGGSGGWSVGSETTVDVGPTNLSEAFFNFVRLVLEDGTYEQTVEAGQSLSLPFAFGVEALGEGGSVGVTLDGYRARNYPVERGVLMHGVQAKLETYTTVTPPSMIDNFINQLQTWMVNKTEDLGTRLLKPARKSFGDLKQWAGNAVVTMQNVTQQEFDNINVLAYDHEPMTGPVVDFPLAPSDVRGSSGKPHYGVGGFYTITPIGKTLTTPAQLSISYGTGPVPDPEALAVDHADPQASGLRGTGGPFVGAGRQEPAAPLTLYRWNDSRGDWDPVPAVNDPVAMTVTASVSVLGTYALAPAMPAGSLTWVVGEVVDSGSVEAPVSRVTLISEPLHCNDGTVVPAGTVVHLDSLLPVGLVVTPDARPQVDGHQIVTDADGRLHLVLELPGRPTSVTVDAFSDLGTISGRVTAAIPR